MGGHGSFSGSVQVIYLRWTKIALYVCYLVNMSDGLRVPLYGGHQLLLLSRLHVRSFPKCCRWLVVRDFDHSTEAVLSL